MALSSHHFHGCFISLLLLCFRASPTLSRSLHDAHSYSDMTERHEKWMTQFGRVYENAAEKARRFEIFKSNVEYINNFNRVGNKTFELAVNEFADLTNEEFRTSRNGFKMGNARTAAVQPTSSSFKYENVTNLPSSMDWRRKGAVAPMKDQGRCGSCWAFSAVAAVEGITKIKTGKLFSLSEEQVIDCDSSDDGCMGGKIDGAYKYIRQHGGLTTGKNYPCIPYGIRHCNRKEAAMIVAKIKGYQDVPKDNEKALLKAVANQPVAVAIDASSDAFQFYSKGVFTGSCETDLDHGVSIVGYGKCKRTGKKYWLVKNSWGKSWGEKGYIRMERDVRSKHGLCGIAKMASYPIA